MIIKAIRWVGGIDGVLELIDQRKLPAKFVKIRCKNIGELYKAIKTLAVRGAPAIGVAAAYGMVLALQKRVGNVQKGLVVLAEAQKYLASSRPTAVNLFWAINRVRDRAGKFVAGNPKTNLKTLREIILKEANAICQEDIDMCRRIGRNGQHLIKNGDGILTHCNAGLLATAGQGTALSVIFEAKKKGEKFKVYADETRPLLQGARLTAWELKQAGINVTVICDNAAGWLIKQGKINLIITGADRIAANGDTANKIGTYNLSILAKEHRIPFYIAAPSSTFDLSIKDGSQIPIEQRDPEEVRCIDGRRILPRDVDVFNPAFDVTEARNITAIITEKSVIEKPTRKKIIQHLRK